VCLHTADLASSLVDGRYNEQKHRMSRNGMGRVIYLVEGHLNSQHGAITTQALRTALATTQIQDGLTVICTANLNETVAQLRRLHRHISTCLDAACRGNDDDNMPGIDDNYGVRPIMTMEHYRRKCGKGKDPYVKHIFGCQLRQVNGCSAQRASAVLSHYPTPLSFILAMESAGKPSCCIELLADIKSGGGTSNDNGGVGSKEAKLTKPMQEALCTLYCEDSYTVS
jgi:crossover junction endonuclease MUS81